MSDLCAATTKSGRPCEKRAVKNGLCALHDDGSIRGRCTAITASGRRCRNKALAMGRCPIHDGSLTIRQELNRKLRKRSPVPESPAASTFVPANQRGAQRDEQGRLRSVLDWRDEVRRI